MKIVCVIISFCVILGFKQVAVASILLESSILTEEELAIMEEREVYTVGYTNNNIPISYEVQGELTGITIDMLEIFAEEMGVTMEYISLDTEGIVMDDLDIIIPMANFCTDPMSDVFMTYQTILVTRADFEGELELVAAQANFGLTTFDPLIENADMLYYSSFVEAKDVLDRGVADGLLMATIGYEKISGEAESGVYNLQVLETPIEFRLTFGDDVTEEEIAIFNKMIGNLDQGNFSLIGEQHSNYIQRTYTVLDSIAANINIVGLGFFVGIITVTFFVLLGQRRKRKMVEKALESDSLTGLLSMGKFKTEVERVLREQPEREFCILSLDMDNFKYINEIYGYEIGTQILIKTAECVRNHIPCIDGIVARNFADNFLSLTTKGDLYATLTGNEEGYSMLKAKLSAILGKDYNFSFSMGVYTIYNRMENVTQMIDGATIARNVGKQTLGYTITEYTEEMRQERSNKNHVVQTMNEGIQRKEFILYYQPKVDLGTGRIIGAEALVRWIQDGKLIPPDCFIPIFEKNGFIEELDYYVFEEVCAFIQRQNGALPIISVNLSWVTVGKDDLIKRLEKILQKYQVQPAQLDLEITESAFVDQFEESLLRLEHLRSLGFTISMDDFGAGISSLNRLKEIPLDIMKIDRGFVMDSLDNKKGKIIIENVIQMGKKLNLETVAEGIETKEQLEFLREMGCDVGQGYYYARPLPEGEFLDKWHQEH